MNVLYSKLPMKISVCGKKYKIATDFRDWIRFADAAEATELTDDDRIEIFMSFFIEERPLNKAAALRALADFYGCKDMPRAGKGIGKGKNKKVFSYMYDAGYVLAAFRQAYSIDLRSIRYMHWYEFRWLFEALPDNIPLKERINYRSINVSDIKDNKERSRIRKIQRATALPNNIGDMDIGSIFGGVM